MIGKLLESMSNSPRMVDVPGDVIDAAYGTRTPVLSAVGPVSLDHRHGLSPREFKQQYAGVAAAVLSAVPTLPVTLSGIGLDLPRV